MQRALSLRRRNLRKSSANSLNFFDEGAGKRGEAYCCVIKPFLPYHLQTYALNMGFTSNMHFPSQGIVYVHVVLKILS